MENTTSEFKVGIEFSYGNPQAELSISESSKALAYYAANFNNAFKLETKTPIFLDTNVLLSFYGMSQTAKNKLIEFLNQNNTNIYITKQIEREFLRNRVSTIKKDFLNPLNNIYSDFEKTCKDIKGKFKSFQNDTKSILSEDYFEHWEKLNKIENELNILLDDAQFSKSFKESIEKTTRENEYITITDKMLEACSRLKVTPSLEQEEVDYIKKQYDELYRVYDEAKDEQKWKFIFPGCGDKKKKPEDPYGDFIIFHEILKFMKKEKTDAIVLTREHAKSDWLQSDKSPIIHYIEKTFLLTQHCLFILHADEPLKISFENIHKEKKSEHLSNSTYESFVYNIKEEQHWGFIYTKNNNLYFNYSSMKNPEDFQHLKKGDNVRYEIAKNENGESVAVNVERFEYSFDSGGFITHKNAIASIGDSYGFIVASPENLFFHHSAVKPHEDFNKLREGEEVEYIVGKNSDGEDVARLVRTVNKVLT